MTIADKWKPVLYALAGLVIGAVLLVAGLVVAHLREDHLRSDQLLELLKQDVQRRQQVQPKPPEVGK